MEKDKYREISLLIACVILVYAVFSIFTGIGIFEPTPYNSYSLQAQAWLDGRLDLGQNYSHLEIATFEGKHYISFPPFPSVIMLLFVPFIGVETPDNFLCLLALIIGAMYAYRIAKKLNWEGKHAVFASLFLTIGGNLIFVGFCGWVWFIAQTFSFALCTASIYYAMKGGKKGFLLSVLLLACAVGCRPFQIVYLPLILYLVWKSEPMGIGEFIRKYALQVIPGLAVGVFYMLLNYLRFENVLEFGHNYLPEFLEADSGQFSLEYLALNIERLFRLPPFENGKLILPQFDGFAFYLASPIFISATLGLLSLKKAEDKRRVFICMALIAVHFICLCMHKTMGGWQFGNRYTIDALPTVFLMYTTLRQKPNYADCGLFLFGLSLNLVGAVLTYIG